MNEIEKFENVVDSIYGVYLDSTLGFIRIIEWVEKNQRKHLQKLKVEDPANANMEYIESRKFIYGKGNPNLPSSVELHRTTVKELKNRNMTKGINYKFIGNLATVLLYQYWEDYYRQIFAKMLKKKKNELTVPIMGDIRLLRKSIIHHQGIALKEIESCELLKWFVEGDEIFIDKNKFDVIVYNIRLFTDKLKNTIYKKTGKSLTNKHIDRRSGHYKKL